MKIFMTAALLAFALGCDRDVGQGQALDANMVDLITPYNTDAKVCIDPCWDVSDMQSVLDLSKVDLSVVDAATPDLLSSKDLSPPADLAETCNDRHKHDTSPGHVKHCGDKGHWEE